MVVRKHVESCERFFRTRSLSCGQLCHAEGEEECIGLLAVFRQPASEAEKLAALDAVLEAIKAQPHAELGARVAIEVRIFHS